MTATLADGAYVVLSAAAPAVALDVSDQADAAGTSVACHTRNGSNAQFVYVTTNDDKTRTLYFPLTGKVLDVTGGAYADGTNLETWDNTGLDPCKFTITDAGTTAEVDGAQVACFFVSPAKAPGLCVCPAGTGAVASGLGVQLASVASGQARQAWAFKALKTLMPGTYRIESAIDRSIVMDVADGSEADGANLMLFSPHGGPNQCFEVVANGDGTIRLLAAHSGKAVSAVRYGRDPQRGDEAVQWHWYGDSNQRWFADWAGWMFGGAADPAFMLRSQFGESELFLDACGDRAVPQTDVWMWDDTGAVAGRAWYLVPTEALVDLPVPTDVRIDVGGPAGTIVAHEVGGVIVHPSWIGSADAWQCRYRTRTRRAGMTTPDHGTWGAWRSIADGSAANGGWGAAWSPNCPVEVSGGRCRSTRGIALTLDAASADLVDVQIEVRAFASSWGEAGSRAHGHSASRTCTVAIRPSLSVGTVAWSPEGLHVPIKMSPTSRGGNRVSVEVMTAGGDRVCAAVSESGQAASCTVDVPGASLLRIPDDGESLVIAFRWETVDGVALAGSVTTTCSWSAGNGETLTPSIAEAPGIVRRVSLGRHASASVWVVTESGGAVSIPVSSDGVADVPVPLGVPYDLFAAVRESDSVWGTWHKAFVAIESEAVVLSWDGGALEMDYGRAAATKSFVNDVSASLTTGREWEVATVGEARSATAEVSGYLLGDAAHDAVGAVHALLAARFAWLRDPTGTLWRVAVEKAGVDQTIADVAKVTVSVRRVS